MDFQVKYGKHLSSAVTKLGPHPFSTQKLAVRVFSCHPCLPVEGLPIFGQLPNTETGELCEFRKGPCLGLHGYTALRYVEVEYCFGLSLSWNVMDIVIIVVVVITIIITCFRMYTKNTL